MLATTAYIITDSLEEYLENTQGIFYYWDRAWMMRLFKQLMDYGKKTILLLGNSKG